MLRFVVLFLSLGLISCIFCPSKASEARCFPSNFLFGTVTAPFQEEGAWNTSSRDTSNWDNSCHTEPGPDCVSRYDDFFHRYREDIQRISDRGLTSFRFSISWSRVMHWNAETGKMQPNLQVIASYHDLLDDMQTKKLQPIATLYRFDLPLMLQTQLTPTGWLSPDIMIHFEDFAELAFREFGKQVKYWVTFDEPLAFVSGGYSLRDADSGAIELSDMITYKVAHNMLLSHARAVAVFRALKEEMTAVIAAGSRIGIVLSAEFGYPLDESNALDVEATERKMQFDLGWFLMPIVTGDYPEIMRERIGDRLPRFSADEAALVKGSYDVFLLNNYYSRAVTNCDSEHSDVPCDKLPQGYARDRGIGDVQVPSDACMPLECFSLAAYPPDGTLAMIKWLHEKDPSTEILLTEKAWCENGQAAGTLDLLQYYQVYMGQLYKAIMEEKIPIIGYTAWSLLDTNERGSYKTHFDLHYANITTRLTQDLPVAPRQVAKWFAHLSTTKCLDGWDHESVAMNIEENQEAAVPREKMLDPEADDNDVGVPWSLSKVVILIIIGGVVLGAITYEAMRELRLSSQGSPEEVQVLITIED